MQITAMERIDLEDRIKKDVLISLGDCLRTSVFRISREDATRESAIDMIKYGKEVVIGAFASNHLMGFVSVSDDTFTGGKEVRCQAVVIPRELLGHLVEAAVRRQLMRDIPFKFKP